LESKKSYLYRLFGVGGLPAALRPALEMEGILVIDEGVRGSITYRNFRGFGRYSSYRKNGFSGTIVLTGKRIIGFAFKKRILNVGLTDPRLSQLEIEAEDKNRLKIAFEAGIFHEKAAGRIEYRYRTAHAAEIATRLK
jgi:hypothetical protein